MAMVTTFAFSPEFFAMVRKMMLLDTLEQQNVQYVKNSSYHELYLSPKIEIMPSQSIEWLYGEIKLKKRDLDTSLSPIRRTSQDLMEPELGVPLLASIISSAALIVEAKDSQHLDHVVKLLKDIYEKVNDLPTPFPKVYAFYNAQRLEENELLRLMAPLRNRNIQFEFVATHLKEEWEEQYRLISVGKGIVNKLAPKVIDKVPLTPRTIVLFWSTLAMSDESVPLTTIWQRTQTALAEEQS
jgi:hypothetical protein